MRGRKNGALSSPANSAPPSASRPDEAELDAAYDRLSAALKHWRRQPHDKARIEALVEAYDARDDALLRVVAADEQASERAGA
jgi:hypothetical protein